MATSAVNKSWKMPVELDVISIKKLKGSRFLPTAEYGNEDGSVRHFTKQNVSSFE